MIRYIKIGHFHYENFIVIYSCNNKVSISGKPRNLRFKELKHLSTYNKIRRLILLVVANESNGS